MTYAVTLCTCACTLCMSVCQSYIQDNTDVCTQALKDVPRSSSKPANVWLNDMSQHLLKSLAEGSDKAMLKALILIPKSWPSCRINFLYSYCLPTSHCQGSQNDKHASPNRWLVFKLEYRVTRIIILHVVTINCCLQVMVWSTLRCCMFLEISYALPKPHSWYYIHLR